MKNVIITILAVLVIGFGGYLVYDKFIKEDKSSPKEESKKEEVKEFKEEELDKYVIYREFNGDFDEDYKERVVVYNLKESDFIKFDCSIYENNPNYEYEKDGDRYIDFKNLNICTGTRIAYNTLNSKYKELFGSKQNFSKDNFSASLTKYEYNYGEDYFELFMAYGTGITSIGGLFPVVTNIEYKENKAIVEAKVAKYECYGKDCTFDGTITDEGITNVDFKEGASKEEMKKIAKEKYLDKFDTYVFTFFNEDNTYKLDSFKLKES